MTTVFERLMGYDPFLDRDLQRNAATPKVQPQDALNCAVPEAPPGVDLNRNIGAASQIWHDQMQNDANAGLPYSFTPMLPQAYAMFHNKAPYDYKQQGKQYAPFGNFNYGAMGSAMGIPENILLRAAGFAQGRAGTSLPQYGKWWSGAPYGDDRADQEQIRNGIGYYNNCYPKKRGD